MAPWHFLEQSSRKCLAQIRNFTPLNSGNGCKVKPAKFVFSWAKNLLLFWDLSSDVPIPFRTSPGSSTPGHIYGKVWDHKTTLGWHLSPQEGGEVGKGWRGMQVWLNFEFPGRIKRCWCCPTALPALISQAQLLPTAPQAFCWRLHPCLICIFI